MNQYYDFQYYIQESYNHTSISLINRIHHCPNLVVCKLSFKNILINQIHHCPNLVVWKLSFEILHAQIHILFDFHGTRSNRTRDMVVMTTDIAVTLHSCRMEVMLWYIYLNFQIYEYLGIAPGPQIG